jgi:hypothetical protein
VPNEDVHNVAGISSLNGENGARVFKKNEAECRGLWIKPYVALQSYGHVS